MSVIKSMLLLLSIVAVGCASATKSFDPEYVKVTNERAQKIVNDLNIADSDKQLVVRDIIAEQYRNLSWIQDGRDAEIDALDQTDLSEAEKDKVIEKLETKAQKDIDKLHKKYINALKGQLSDQQVVQVKDGMTYGVVPLTYNGYLDMLPELTEPQKKVIHEHLVEAREIAMDAGSSDQKHWWFGKYKGKINNYLSDQGYDLGKASKEWQARLKAEKNQ